MDTRTEPDDTDRLLVNAAQRGDREAFSRIYEANVSRVYHYLLTIVPQPADAEDATAEVFIKPESTEGGRRVSILKRPEGALLNLG